MNSVREQCPNSDSETVLSLKTGSKLSEVHRAPNLAQPMHIDAPRRARVAVSQAAAVVSQASQRCVGGAAWPCRGSGPWPCHRVCGRVAAAAPGRVVALYRDTGQQPSSLLVTIHPSILQYSFLLLKPPQS